MSLKNTVVSPRIGEAEEEPGGGCQRGRQETKALPREDLFVQGRAKSQAGEEVLGSKKKKRDDQGPADE